VASFHVTFRCDLFISYKDGDYGVIRMRNNEVYKISKIKNICVDISLGCKLILKEVWHVSDMRLYLISICALDNDGYQNHFFGGSRKVLRGHLNVT
jgi:hypothetical protein